MAGEDGDKPLPLVRPGTAGTEVALRSNRQVSYTAYKRAHQAEQKYRAQKQARQAKIDCLNAKTELREAATHFKKGFCSAFGGLRALPAVVRARREDVREKRARKERDAAMKKKELWEKKAKEAAENAPEVPAKDGEEEEAA